MFGYRITHQLPNIGKQFICLWDIFQSEPVVVEVIVDNSSIGLASFGYMRKKSGTAKLAHKHGIFRELFQNFNKLFSKHSFLAHKWQRCRQIHFRHTFNSNLIFSTPDNSSMVRLMLFSYICTFPRSRVKDFKGSSTCLAIR